MICCGMQAIRNVVLNEEFWYCRECKQEVKEKEGENDDGYYGRIRSVSVKELVDRYPNTAVLDLMQPIDPMDLYQIWTDEQWESLMKSLESVQ